MQKFQRGFTLIELLVVVAIIGTLSSIVLASVSSARENARLAAGKQFEANIYHSAGDMLVGDWEFNECSGTTTVDLAGYNNTGSLLNSTNWSTNTPTNKGCSISLNGNNNSISIGSPSIMDFSGDITISAWINPDNIAGGTYRSIVGKRGSGTNFEMTLGNTTGALLWYNGTVYQSTFIPPLNKWTHIAGVISGTTLTLYADGKSIYTTTISGGVNNTTNPLSIGATGNLSGQNFSGLIDGVRIYAKSLIASDIENIYRKEKAEYKLAKN